MIPIVLSSLEPAALLTQKPAYLLDYIYTHGSMFPNPLLAKKMYCGCGTSTGTRCQCMARVNHWVIDSLPLRLAKSRGNEAKAMSSVLTGIA